MNYLKCSCFECLSNDNELQECTLLSIIRNLTPNSTDCECHETILLEELKELRRKYGNMETMIKKHLKGDVISLKRIKSTSARSSSSQCSRSSASDVSYSNSSSSSSSTTSEESRRSEASQYKIYSSIDL
jgi:hypothetical protein